MATISTMSCAGTFLTHLIRLPMNGRPNSIISPTKPMIAISGLMLRSLPGNSAISSSGPTPFVGVTPITSYACLAMIMMPMLASIPCTGVSGKKSASRPARNNPKRI